MMAFWQRWQKQLTFVVVLVSVLFLGALYFSVIDTEVLGFTHDDGVYVLLAKALAEGDGYTLSYLVEPMGQVKYPILYPLFLSLAWKLNPHFPENIPLLNGFTIGATLAGLFVVLYYLRNCKNLPGWLSLAILFLLGSNYYFINFATTMMAEGLYVLLSFATLLFAERFFRPDSKWHLATLILLSALTFHARLFGLTLIAALTAWLLIRKQWKISLFYLGATLFLTAIPWFIWIKVNTPTDITLYNQPLILSYSNYGLELFSIFQSGEYLDRVINTFGAMIFRILEGMFQVIPNFFKLLSVWNKPLAENPMAIRVYLVSVLICSYDRFGYFTYRALSGIKRAYQKRSLAGVALSDIYLVFYLALMILWSYENQIPRFLIPLLPLFWVHFFKPILAWKPKQTSWLKPTAIVCILLTALVTTPNILRSLHFIRQHHWIDTGKAPWLWEEYQAAFQFIKQNLSPDTPLASPNDVVFSLYTQQPSYLFHQMALQKKDRKYTAQDVYKLMPSLDYYQVKYLVVEPELTHRMLTSPEQPLARLLLDRFPERFQLEFTSPRHAVKLYRILPEQQQSEPHQDSP